MICHPCVVFITCNIGQIDYSQVYICLDLLIFQLMSDKLVLHDFASICVSCYACKVIDCALDKLFPR
jgi:hypothetical protein